MRPADLAAAQVHPERVQLDGERVVTASGVGLAFQRAQLTTHLAEEVLEADEVGLGGVEPALRLLPPPAVLQHAGGLLDDEAPVLGPGVEHRVELALRNDHVLLAAHAAVGQQLLDIEQPAGNPVDCVLALARAAEQRAGKGYLGEADRQQAGAVVDGERDLGAAQRRPLGRAGEDDVLHLRAAHGAGALGTEHPRHRVDDVGFAAPVRADHDGDPRLEFQGRRLGEGLETLERERLQKHSKANLATPSG